MISRVFFMLLLAAATLAQAQTYRSTDGKGRVQFSDTPPKGATPAAGAPREAADAEPAPQQTPYEVQRAQKDFPVTVFSAPICKEPCDLARAALNKRGVPFTEIQVYSPETLEQLKSRAGSDTVPAILVGRSVLSGFEQGRLDSLLDSAGYPKEGSVPARKQQAPAPPEGFVPPPTAEPVAAEPAGKPGPYDTSGLRGPAPKQGPYDPSGLRGPQPKPGPYLKPEAAK